MKCNLPQIVSLRMRRQKKVKFKNLKSFNSINSRKYQRRDLKIKSHLTFRILDFNNAKSSQKVKMIRFQPLNKA